MLKSLVNSVRRNHALEHATISILAEPAGTDAHSRHAPWRMGSTSTETCPRTGCVSLPDEALLRLQKGEAHLAVSPLCGTNIAVAGVLAGLGSYAAMGAGPRKIGGVSGAIMAAMLAVSRRAANRSPCAEALHDVTGSGRRANRIGQAA